MSSVDIFVVVFCAVLGYLIVDHLLGIRSRAQAKGTQGQRSTADAEERHRRPASERPRAWWDVLGVNAGASEEEVQRAYRAEISKYHPDKVAHLGDELKAVADQRSKEINLAYREAMRFHGKAV